MKFNVQHIIEGWRNHLIPPEKLKEIISHIGKERIEICRQCEYNSKNMKNILRPDEHCTLCGCPLIALTKCLSCSCSFEQLPKWSNIITIEEEEKLHEE